MVHRLAIRTTTRPTILIPKTHASFGPKELPVRVVIKIFAVIIKPVGNVKNTNTKKDKIELKACCGYPSNLRNSFDIKSFMNMLLFSGCDGIQM